VRAAAGWARLRGLSVLLPPSACAPSFAGGRRKARCIGLTTSILLPLAGEGGGEADGRGERQALRWGGGAAAVVYCDGKIVALVCDDQLFVKVTEAARAWLGDAVDLAPAYPGAKPSFRWAGSGGMTRSGWRSW
jgi:hypothetical protein